MVYFVRVVELHITAYLKWNPAKVLCQKFDEGVVCSILKDRKSSHDDNERKSAFQAIAIELYKQQKQTNKKRTPKISNMLY